MDATSQNLNIEVSRRLTYFIMAGFATNTHHGATTRRA